VRDFDLLAYIGRFQPFHNGHKHVIDIALERAERVAVVIGSHDKPRSPRNPWYTHERAEMIRACYSPSEQARLLFVPQVDHTYNLDKWLAGVTTGVYTAAWIKWKPDAWKIGLIGFDKDDTSFYLHHFPQWNPVYYDPRKIINATDIRRSYFDMNNSLPAVYAERDVLPPATLEFMQKFAVTYDYLDVRDEWKAIEAYKRAWAFSPFAPTFQTADAIVVQAGHVLLVQRDTAPGKGLWALPGGFVNPGEKVKDAALRELKEETKIRISGAQLRGSIVAQRMFDDPNRSERGRTVTQAYLIRLNEKTLPKVEGASDARQAKWVPLGQLTRTNMFEDHFDIIEAMVAF